MKLKNLKWYSAKDNDYSVNIPGFIGQSSLIQKFSHYGYFVQLFPESIFELIAYESHQFAA